MREVSNKSLPQLSTAAAAIGSRALLFFCGGTYLCREYQKALSCVEGEGEARLLSKSNPIFTSYFRSGRQLLLVPQ
jgi:hypothetical protein